ncbi:MAG: hypothetical protein ACRD3N_18190 [Terracidiphilus sp.]
MRRGLLPLLFWCLATTILYAAGPAFDLAGPKVDIHVKRGDITLPISETPNLLPGDRLWIHPDLPESQSAHFVLVIAFLRGATNPPPPDWFTRVETWNRDVQSEGVFVTVPEGAEQALLFLAPETGGDFNTLRSAVRSLPGSFVRASQDLVEASWERMRLEDYLNEVKVTSQTDPKTLKARAEMAARSLGIKINESCFDKPEDQQDSCLSQNSEGLVLDDTNAQSLVAQIASGDTLNLVNQIGATPMGGAGLYSPYIGAILDTARILASLHTAHFQYIPALALPRADTLNLRLNMPPSFRNPKSVVVIALPPIGSSQPEPLHPIDPSQEFCVEKPGLVLPAEGAPLTFATHLAHHLDLHIETQDGAKGLPVNLPVVADPSKGGLVLEHPAPALPGGPLIGVLEGKWGFDDLQGPQYLLRASAPGDWALTSGGESALVVGRDDTLHLAGQDTLCVDKVEVRAKDAGTSKVLWKSPTPDSLKVTVPLKDAAPGEVALSIYQYGLKSPETIHLEAYADAASLQLLTLSEGDKDALLQGTRLDEVSKAELEGIDWKPGALTRVHELDQLTLSTGKSTSKLKPGKLYTASVELLDGRKLKVPVAVEPPRPEAALLSEGIQPDSSDQLSPVTLGSPSDLPLEGRLVFFLKATTPPDFSRDEKAEVAAADGSFHTTLDFANGGLLLEDASTVMGSLDPLKSFGESAFGPIQVRLIAADGAAGDWLPLGTLVRLPGFTDLRCPRAISRPCTLTGSDLFLAASFSSTEDYGDPTDVPLYFTGTGLTVPHPVDGKLYMKLRDDLATVQTLTLPVTWIAERQRPERREPNPVEPAAPVEPAPGTQPTVPPTATPGVPGTKAPGTQAPANPGQPANPAPPKTQTTTEPPSPGTSPASPPMAAKPAAGPKPQPLSTAPAGFTENNENQPTTLSS